MNYCIQCAAPLVDRVPAGDDRERRVCDACGHVHYRNPLVVVGTLVELEGGLLLCRRAIEPARGRWTVPAGFLELGEGARDGARRETREEARAEVEIESPQALLDLPDIGQVYQLFHARLAPGSAPPSAGEESLEVETFALDRLPWEELAFPVVEVALRLFLEDRAAGRRGLHLGVLRYGGTGPRFRAESYRLEDHQHLELPPPVR